MWGNYLTVAYRALTKNRTYAVINIVGLALGLAACLLLLLYVRYELSFDRWVADSDRVYQVQTFGTDPETGESLNTQGVTQPVAAALEKDFPEFEAVSKLEPDKLVVLRKGEALAVDQVGAVDARFLDIIPVPFLRGDARSALRDPSSLALSRSEALRLFGSLDVLGRPLTVLRGDEKGELRITGVFEDLPTNSHMSIRALRRFLASEAEGCPWGCVNGTAYVKLKRGVDVDAINGRMAGWEKRNVPAKDMAGRDLAKLFDWRLVNIRDVHLGPAQDSDKPGNDIGTIVTFATVALLILAMACINFVNLATARAGQRAREVAVRKVLGARRSQLVVQFLGESVLLVTAAMLIALALVELTLPAFSAFLEADLDIVYLGSGGVLPAVLGLTLIVGMAGGLYPAFYLSRFEPAAVLKANRSAAEPRGNAALRAVLVVGQFAVSIGLIICTAVVYHQTVFARSSDPGYEREGLLIVSA